MHCIWSQLRMNLGTIRALPSTNRLPWCGCPVFLYRIALHYLRYGRKLHYLAVGAGQHRHYGCPITALGRSLPSTWRLFVSDKRQGEGPESPRHAGPSILEVQMEVASLSRHCRQDSSYPPAWLIVSSIFIAHRLLQAGKEPWVSRRLQLSRPTSILSHGVFLCTIVGASKPCLQLLLALINHKCLFWPFSPPSNRHLITSCSLRLPGKNGKNMVIAKKMVKKSVPIASDLNLYYLLKIIYIKKLAQNIQKTPKHNNNFSALPPHTKYTHYEVYTSNTTNFVCTSPTSHTLKPQQGSEHHQKSPKNMSSLSRVYCYVLSW